MQLRHVVYNKTVYKQHKFTRKIRGEDGVPADLRRELPWFFLKDFHCEAAESRWLFVLEFAEAALEFPLLAGLIAGFQEAGTAGRWSF